MNTTARRAWKLNATATALCALCVCAATASHAAADDLPSAERRSLRVEEDGSVVFRLAGGAERTFRPRFLLLYSPNDPRLAARPANLGKMKYNVASWVAARGAGGGLTNENTTVTAGDGHDERILQGDTNQRTADYFAAAPWTAWEAVAAKVAGKRVTWQFAPHEWGALAAEIELSDAGWPALVTRFEAKRPGYYSLGYAGAPAADVEDAEEIWQPLIWQGRRLPDQSYLTLAYRCTLPAPMVRAGGVTTAVVVDPRMLPFQPLPVEANSGFGVAVRNEQGRLQSLVFAPALGAAGSRMQAGESRNFCFRLFAQQGAASEAYERIARDLYDFRDYRTNALGSLNAALENMIAYGLSPHAQFIDELRGCSYSTDVPGAVKNVSALHPMSAALVTDDPEIYERRVRPITEYLLSREKFLFAVSPDVKIQNPSWRLKGPCAPTSELAALHQMTGGSNPYLLELAQEMLGKTRMLNLDTPSPARRWDKVLAVAQAAHDEALLSEAIERADAYLAQASATSPDDFQRQDAPFWDQLVPQFPELLTLYEATGEPRYLRAAHEAARAYAQFVWMCPRIPDEQTLVNPGGKAPHYWYLRSKGHPQMSAPAQYAEAWRLSEIGLTAEGPATSTGHRGVFLATHAPWMMRIGALTGDKFLQDIARSAVVGRYRNFPGYHLNTARTTVYESADYPLRPHRELSYNSFHYNHIWPHAALLIDYLASDAFAKSGGQIDFPAQFAEGYAYLKGKAYGDRPGRFYDEDQAWLWMPRGLLHVDNPQLNYVAARRGDTLYLAVTNQSFEPQSATLALNPQFVRCGAATSCRTWVNNVPIVGEVVAGDGELAVDVPASGLVALALSGVELAERKLPLPVGERQAAGDSDKRFVALPFAERTTGLVLQYGARKSVYVYLQATHETVAQATLHYRLTSGGDGWRQIEDASYPYEYTVELPPPETGLEFYITASAPDGSESRSDVSRLEAH